VAKVFPERLPESILSDPRRSAERKLYDALSNLNDKFTVYYSVAWQARERNRGAKDGEADFVIAHPDFGVIIMEVKGGGISYDAHTYQWYSIDRHGEQHTIKDPVEQARNSKYELLKKFNDLPEWEDRWLTMGHVVAFPDIYTEGKSLKPDIPLETVLDAGTIQDVGAAIQKAFRFFASEDHRSGGLGYDRLQLLDSLLANSFQLKTPLGVELAFDDERLIELTERQMMLLDFLGGRRRAAIKGCAGSGKTMLAVEKVRRLAEQGYDVLLTCYNYALARYLAQSAPDGVSVMHFHGLCREMAKEAGYTIKHVSSEQEFYDRVLPDALLEAVDKIGPQFDAIVVDEGQDFKEDWLLPLVALLRDPDQGILYFFFDDNQNIYQSVGSIPGVVDEAPYPLVDNCRNTQKIHNLVASFHPGQDQLRCPGPPGRSPEIHFYRETGSQERLVRQILYQLVQEEHISNEDIVILTPRSQTRTDFKDGTRLGNFTLVSIPPRRQNEIQVSSVHTFKGLERRVVIFTEIDQVASLSLDLVLYVGCSRARTHLILLVDENIESSVTRKLEQVVQ
jgi:hypothetical protein